jgi:hypothetical protein
MARSAKAASDPKKDRDRFDILVEKLGVPRARLIEEWGERAAIRQYLGNMSRADAEVRAFDDVEAMFTASSQPEPR